MRSLIHSGLPLMDRAQAVDEVLLLLERFARHAVPAFVHALVDVAGVPRPFEQRLHRAHVAALGRPDEVVEGNVQACPDGAELHLHPVAVRERVEIQLTRFAEDVLRVLVIAHDEADIEPRQPLVAGDDVGGDLLVRGPEMRPVVDVVDGGREVEARHGKGLYAKRTSSFVLVDNAGKTKPEVLVILHTPAGPLPARPSRAGRSRPRRAGSPRTPARR